MEQNELLGAISEFGIDGVADRLEVSEDFIERCLGDNISRSDSALLDRAFAEYEITELERGDTSELDRIEELGNAIGRMEYFAGDENWGDLKSSIIDGIIDPDRFEVFETLAANLTDSQLGRVMEYISESGTGAIDAAFSEYDFDDSYFFDDSSEFWEWFRETFYE